MEKKLFILQRIGQKYGHDTRYFKIYRAPVSTLEQFGLAESGYSNSIEFSLSFYYNVNTGEFDFKTYLHYVKIHSGEIELILDNNVRVIPKPIPLFYKIQASYDSYLNRWDKGGYKEDGYRYELSPDDYLKIANSSKLSGIIHVAYLKTIEFQVDDRVFEQLKDCIITRFSDDRDVIDRIYSKYSSKQYSVENVSDGVKKEFKPVEFKSSPFAFNKMSIALILVLLIGILFYLLKYNKREVGPIPSSQQLPTSNGQASVSLPDSKNDYKTDTLGKVSVGEVTQGISDPNYALSQVSIGNQIWMAVNLDVDKFRNGDPIPEAQTEEEWREAARMGTPAWCYVKGNSANAALGKLYNWYAVNDERGLAPEGWHIPSQSELQKLVKIVGVGNSKVLKYPNKWNDCVGTNSLGFSALPTGYRDSYCDNEGCFAPFKYLRILSGFWSSTDFNDNGFIGAISFRINCDGTDSESGYNVSFDSDMIFEHDYKGCGFAVRCLKD